MFQKTEPPERRNLPGHRWPGHLWIALLPLLALVVIRPWTPSAFPVWDYSEMLPILRGTDGWPDAVQQLAAFTRQDGRANYLTYLQIAWTWALAGDHPIGWQWQRAIFMLVLGISFAFTARRLGASPVAAGSGGLLLTITVPATEGWQFLMGEPLAASLLLWLILVLRAPTWRVHRSWPVVVAALALAVMATKEFVGLLLPLAVLFGLGWSRSDGFRLRPCIAATRRLGPWLVASAAIGIGSALAATRDAVPGAYATALTIEASALPRVPTLAQVMALPARFASASESALLYPANLAWLLGVVLAVPAFRRLPDRKGAVHLAIFLALAPVIGAVAYAFWPRFSAFYGIPFSLGGVGLFVAATSAVAHATPGRSGRLLATMLLFVACGYTAIVAERTTTDKRAIADLAAAVVHAFAARDDVDTVYVTRVGPGAHRWPITGSELQRYSNAILPGTHAPRYQDASCGQIAERVQLPLERVAVLNDRNPCGALPGASLTLLAPARYHDWLTLAPQVDTIRLQLLLPRED